jgi:hypothetical protein
MKDPNRKTRPGVEWINGHPYTRVPPKTTPSTEIDEVIKRMRAGKKEQ